MVYVRRYAEVVKGTLDGLGQDIELSLQLARHRFTCFQALDALKLRRQVLNGSRPEVFGKRGKYLITA